MRKLSGLYILDGDAFKLIYGAPEQQDIGRLVNILVEPQTSQSINKFPELLKQADVIFSGWGGPLFNQAFLDSAPQLQAIFYGAGSMSNHLTDAVWSRHIAVTCALNANAQPVAEYALGTILFSLKQGWQLSRMMHRERIYPDRNNAPGAYGSTVGIISLGAIARTLIRMLKPFDIKVIAYDPFLTPLEAEELGIESVTLDQVFERADVVSLHAPFLKETQGMITASHFNAMRPGGTFINTARGSIVRHDDLIAVAMRRPDLQFVLDVTDPEPLPAHSQLFDLDNVVLTPHIAGSAGNECRRMGRAMVNELELFIAGKPMRWQLSPDSVRFSSHLPTSPATHVDAVAR